jgi:hypothetical protein
MWGNTDVANQKPKSPNTRNVREVIQLQLGAWANTGQNAMTLIYNDGAQNNVANIGIASGMYTYVYRNGLGATAPGGNGYPNMFASNNTVNIVSGNTINLTNNLFANTPPNTWIEFDKVLSYNTNKPVEKNYNQDVVLVTPTRLANASFATNGTAHAGWVKVTTGTGGRAGRVQTEVLVAMANTVAANVLSGNTSNSIVYYAGV